MRPVLIQIGDFEFYSFGLMAALALIVPGLSIVRALLRRRGAAADFAYELIVAAGVGGFLGARVYYLLEHLEAVRADFLGVAFGGIGFTWYGASSAASPASSSGRWSVASRSTSSPTPWRRPPHWAT